MAVQILGWSTQSHCYLPALTPSTPQPCISVSNSNFVLQSNPVRVGTKPGLWTGLYGLDYGLDYGLNFGPDFGPDSIMYELTLCFGTFQAFPTVQFLIASSLVPKVMIIQTSMHFFQCIWQRLKPSQCIGR